MQMKTFHIKANGKLYSSEIFKVMKDKSCRQAPTCRYYSLNLRWPLSTGLCSECWLPVGSINQKAVKI